MTETTGAPWASVNGAMHACGHDVHMAALVAFGRALQEAGGPRPALAVLQPREESLPSGARDIVESAELAARPVGAFLGVHLHPSLPAGTIAVQAGPVNAAADEFTVTITGQPGHAAYPHLGRDPVVAAAATVMALQHLISRRINPMHPAVLTVGALQAGTVSNAIPETAVLKGTLRAFDEDDRAQLHDTVSQTATLTAQAYGCSARGQHRPGRAGAAQRRRAGRARPRRGFPGSAWTRPATCAPAGRMTSPSTTEHSRR